LYCRHYHLHGSCPHIRSAYFKKELWPTILEEIQNFGGVKNFADVEALDFRIQEHLPEETLLYLEMVYGTCQGESITFCIFKVLQQIMYCMLENQEFS
jgi:hypothetical protein